MADIFEKVDKNTMKKTVVEARETLYDYNFLLRQKAELEMGLQEVNGLIAQAQLLGVSAATGSGEIDAVEIKP